MNLTKIAASILLVAMLAVPATASTDWVDDFLHRYDPRTVAPRPESGGGLNIGDFLRTGQVTVSLNDVINMTLDTNLDIRSNRFTPRSQYFQSLVSYRALQPSLRFSANVARDTLLSTTQLNGASARQQLNGNYEVTFSQLLPTGTSLTVDATMNRLSNNSNNSIFNPSWQSRLTYAVGQHLLQNRGRLVNTRQILQAQNNEKMSEVQFEIQLTTLIATAQKGYWDLVYAGEDLDVKRRSLELANQTLDENKLRVDIGTLAPIDVVQTQADVASRQEQVVVSTYNVTTSEDQIKKLISDDKDPAMFFIKLKAMESPTRPDDVRVPSLEEAVKTAFENRPEMRQAYLDLKNKDIDVQYTKNQTLPIFDVTASFNQNGTGGEQRRGFLLGSPAFPIPKPGGIYDSLSQLFGYSYRGYSVGFSFVIPLDNKANDADYER